MSKSAKTLVFSLILLVVVSLFPMSALASAQQDDCGLVCRLINLFNNKSPMAGAVIYDPTCGSTINDDVTLTSDMICNENALNIGANDITIDCAGNSIAGVAQVTYFDPPMDEMECFFGICDGDPECEMACFNCYMMCGPDSGCWESMPECASVLEQKTYPEKGIALNSKQGVTIKNCDISNFKTGISLSGSSNNNLENMDISSNKVDGITLSASGNNVLRNLNISLHGRHGIHFASSSSNNLVDDVDCSFNNLEYGSFGTSLMAGILFENSPLNRVDNSRFHSNFRGVQFFRSSDNNITNSNFSQDYIYASLCNNIRIINNTFQDRSPYTSASVCLGFSSSSYNELLGNDFNLCGIDSSNGHNNLIKDNTLSNAPKAIDFFNCNDNEVTNNNFIDNSINIELSGSYSGTTFNHNYWSDHSCTGNPCSVPYMLPGGLQDSFPYENENGWKAPAEPEPFVLTCGESHTAGMVSYWKADGDALDSVDGNDGTINGATFTAGQVGQAFSFDGVDDYVNIADHASIQNLHSNAFTVSAWIKTNVESGALQTIITKGYDDTAWYVRKGWLFFLDTSNHLKAFIPFDGAASPVAISNEILNRNQWYHVAMTYDHDGDKKVGLFINGAEVPHTKVNS